MITQFWNTWTGLESQGQLLPKEFWGIHGLWPDFCNGSYTQYCDLKLVYSYCPLYIGEPISAGLNTLSCIQLPVIFFT